LTLKYYAGSILENLCRKGTYLVTFETSQFDLFYGLFVIINEPPPGTVKR
jgi:hypothetical protein